MFTGIIEEIGKVLNISRIGNSVRLRIGVDKIIDGLKNGDSVSVNGACLTVVNLGRNFFEVDAVEETVSKTNLGRLNAGGFVNLERARMFNDRIDGHIVQGHIDTTGKIEKIVSAQVSKFFFISFPKEFKEFVVPKGSIAIDGISLTIVEVGESWFSVSIIPYTIENTTLKNRKVGDIVNLEFDILGKYVVNFLKIHNRSGSSSIFDQFYEQPL
ncbi:riboflavin synthase [Bacteroidetes/Chlorobi group bacterium Naka2016]|jgi:riboflavin synthase|nr:MAG: riboflavin synthase [Bacteroidetes/Chlorobi group bacterium Naka2016]